MGYKLPRAHKKAISEGQRKRFLRVRELQVSHPDKKRCTQCHELKDVDWEDHSNSDFPMRKTKLKSGVVAVYPRPECRVCSSKRTAAWRDRERAAGRLSDRERGWAKNRDQDNRRRLQREAQATYRRKNGVQPRGPWKKYREAGKGKKLPLGPFSTWLAQQCVLTSIAEVAKKCNMNESQIRRWTSGRDGDGTTVRSISVDAADRVFVALKQPDQMAVLYPPNLNS